MEKQGDEIHIGTDEARGGSTPNVVRWVLAISLLAAIVLLSIIWMTGAATQGAKDGSIGAMAPLREERAANRTDSIVDDRVQQVDTTTPGSEPVAPAPVGQ